MASDIVLSSALRNNLLSLQNTQRSIDTVQLRLATGKKINSALDGPSAFFSSQALTNRASDLTRLLDSINQSLRTIEEADKGVTALNSLVEQAQSIAESARDELAGANAGARMIGNVDLRNYSSVTTGAFSTAGLSNGDQFRITTTNDAGTQIVNTFVLNSAETAANLMARITDTYRDTRNGEIIAELTDDGFIDIHSKDGRSFKIQDHTATVASSTALSTAGWTALGLGLYFEDEIRGPASNSYSAATVVGGSEVFSISLYEAPGGVNLADAGDNINSTTYYDAVGNVVIQNLSTNSSFNFIVNNGTSATGASVVTAVTTWQDLVDQINQSTAVNTLISANFDDATGRFSITSLSDSVENVQMVTVVTNATAANPVIFDIGLGDPTGNMDPVIALGSASGAGTFEQVIGFNSSTETLDNLAKDYNVIRDQIDELTNDANYKGINLLGGDVLTTYFNEDNSSLLETEGQDLTSNGLGLTEAVFRTSAGIAADLVRVQDALGAVRSFATTLANSLAVIQTRRDFTESTIAVLKAGSEDLTVADQNEEGANLLALQTRQQLGVTSLALASQSQQSVLRLF